MKYHESFENKEKAKLILAQIHDKIQFQITFSQLFFKKSEYVPRLCQFGTCLCYMSGQVPFVAGLPFLSVTAVAPCISLFVLHFHTVACCHMKNQVSTNISRKFVNEISHFCDYDLH